MQGRGSELHLGGPVICVPQPQPCHAAARAVWRPCGLVCCCSRGGPCRTVERGEGGEREREQERGDGAHRPAMWHPTFEKANSLRLPGVASGSIAALIVGVTQGRPPHHGLPVS
jgi:hypothetical protein